ncbi:tandem-95 repeat protein [Cryomorphaceae bacterium]|nr:tandem-95 repeat protein [Cryomorphaceae bacterium]
MKALIRSFQKSLVLLFISLLVHPLVYAEGSKEANANGGPTIQLEVGRSLAGQNLGPYFGSDATQRIYVTLDNADEALYFGFDEDGSDNLWVRIMDSGGNKVWPAGTSQSIPGSGTGYIDGQSEADNGPNYPTGSAAQSSGYDAFVFSPAQAGEYYIEFNNNSGTSWSGGFGSTGELVNLWDFTVINTVTHTIQEGRLWNRSWTLRNDDGWGTPFSNETFIYTADGTVTKFWGDDFNPFAWNTFANSTGTGNTGDIEEDRKSRTGYAGTPEHKLFWNEPDINVFPNGTMPTVSTDTPVIEGCLGDYCVRARFNNAGGLGRILLDLDGPDGVYTPGTADVLLEEDVPAAGWHCFVWDGKDGLGATVSTSVSMNLSVDIIAGVTHFPTFDTECNLDGYKVERVRPQSNVPDLFWDDSEVPDPSNENPDEEELQGCTPVIAGSGCHTWTGCTNGTYGDAQTINTWWYSYIESSTFNSIPISSSIGQTTVTASDPPSCNGESDGVITVSVSGGSSPYTIVWNSGSTTTNSNTYLVTGLAAGTYNFTVTDNDGCTNNPGLTLTEPDVLNAGDDQVNVDINGQSTGSATISASGGTTPYTFVWSNGESASGVSELQITGLAAGTYTGTVTDANGCKDITSVTITERDLLEAGVDAQSPASSCTNADGSATISASGGDGSYTYTWPGGSTDNPNNSLAGGDYQVTVTDGVGAKALVDVTIGEPASPTAISGVNTDFNGSDVSCAGASDANIGVTASGGAGGYSYEWNTGSTDQDVDGLGAGEYQVTVTDAGGCTVIVGVTVTDPSSLSLDNSRVSDNNGSAVSCNGGSDATISITASGGTGSLTYGWTGPSSFSSSSEDLTGLEAGVYALTITDANGCTVKQGYTLTEPTALTFAATDVSDYNGSDISCNGADDATLGVTASGGTGVLTYAWTGPSGYSSTNQDISSLEPGTYKVTVTDANSCTTEQNFTLTEPASVTISSSDQSSNNGFGITCNGADDGAIGVTASGGTGALAYSWTGPSGYTSSNQDISNLEPGTYRVTVTDDNSCSTKQNFTVTEPTALTMTSTDASDFNGSGVSCNGASDGTLGATASGGAGTLAYSWSGPGFTSSNQDVSNLGAGVYAVTVTDDNGCELKQSFTVTEPTALSGGASATTDYSGFNVSTNGGNDGAATVTASGGTPAYSYEWSNGSNLQSPSGLSAGSYDVTITDANGCTLERTVTLTEPNNFDAGTSVTSNYNGAEISCASANDGTATVTASGGATPYTYLWENGTSTANVSGLSSGSHQVTVTDNNGYQNIQSVSLTAPSAVTASADVTSNFNGADVSCAGASDGQAGVTASGGTGAYTYLWSNSESTQTISGLSAGTYDVSVYDVNSCLGTASVTISDPVQISASASVTSSYNGSQVSCNGASDGQASVTGSGGTGGYTYLWSNSATTQMISGLAAGSYDVSVYDDNGCQATAGVTITAPTAITSGASVSSDYNGFDITCVGASDGSALVTASGGTGAYTYLWSNGQTNSTLQSVAAGIYGVTVYDVNGCTSTAQVTLSDPTALTASVGVTSGYNGQDISCNGESDASAGFTVSGGTGNFTYLWSNGQTTENLMSVGAGTYSVTATDENGCTVQGALTITEPEVLTAGASVSSNYNGRDLSCNGAADGSALVTVSGGTTGYSYSWSDGQTTATASGLSSGAYGVTITDVNGCMTYATVTLTDPPSLTSSGITTDILCFGESTGAIDLTPSGGTVALDYSYQWSTGAATQDVSNLSAGTYSVTVTDDNGCTHVNSFVLTQPAAALDVSGTYTDATSGLNNGTISATINGGVAPYFQDWSDAGSGLNRMNLAPGTYTLSVTDANGCFDEQTWVIDGNDPPVAVGLTVSTPEDTPISIPVTVNDYDIDSNIDPTTVTITGQPSNGSVSVDPVTGAVTYTPDPNFNGTDTFIYQVCDDGTPLPALCDTAIVEVIVGGINDDPVAVNDTVLNLPTGDTTLVDVLANDFDPDGDPISTFTILVPPTSGTATQIGNDIQYISTPGTSGLDSLQYAITDGLGGFDTAWVYIDVIITNLPPVAIDDMETTSVNTPVVVDVLNNDSDPNGNLDSTSVVLVSGPSNGTVVIDPVTGEITYTPNLDFEGNDTLTYAVCDTGIPIYCDTAEVVITVEPRTLTINSTSYCESDVAYLAWEVVADNFPSPGLVTITFLDNNGNPAVVYTDMPMTDTILYPGMVVDANGNPIDWPGWIFQNGQWMMADDGFQDLRPTASVVFAVNPSDTIVVSYPPATPACAATPPIPPQAVNDTLFTPINTPVSNFILLNDTAYGANIDPGSAALTIAPQNGNFFYDFTTGFFQYTPNNGFSGIDSLQYSICDDHAVPLCDTAWIYITIGAGNDMPMAVDDYDTTSANTPVTVDVLVNDTDPENNIDPTSVTITDQPSNGTASVDPVTGEITYIPDLDWTGTDTLTYQVCDTGMPILCDEAEVYITVEPRTITVNTGSACISDVAYLYWDVSADNFASPGLVTVTFVDAQGGTIASYVDQPMQDTLLWPGMVVDANGNPTDWPGWVYTNGTWVQTSDGFEDTRPVATILFTVNPTDTLFVSYPPATPACAAAPPTGPTATLDNAMTTVGMPVDISVLANDIPGSAPLDSATYVELTAPMNGTASYDPATGELTYTPNPGFTGLDSLEYQICDQNTPSLCSTAWVMIDVTDAPNMPPVAVNDSASTPQGSPVTIDAPSNDSDPDGAVDETTVVITNSPDNGSATVDPITGEITYTPGVGFAGTDSLQYSICDNGNPTLCDTAWVYIDVEGPTGPVANMDTATTSWSTPVDIDLPANDFGTSNPLDLTSVTVLDGPNNGVYSLDPNTGVLTYVADSGFVGVDTITYLICDQGNPALCDTAIAVVTVEEREFVILYADSFCADNVPYVTYSVQVVNFPPPPTITLYWMDSLDVIVQVDSGLPYTGIVPWAGVVLDNNGNCVDWPGWELINGQWLPANDGFGATAPAANLIVSVNPTDTINIPYPPASATCQAIPFSNPIAVNDTVGVNEDTPVTIDVIATDIPDGAFFDSTSVAIIQGPWEGTATVDPVTGEVIYTPGPNFFGPDSLQYVICDQNAVPLCDTAWVYVFFVFPVNDPPVAVDDYTGTPPNTPVDIDVLSNDYDVDNDLDTNSMVINTPPANGMVTIDYTTGLHTYTPDPGFSGLDTYVYTVCEDTVPALCDTATVYVLVDVNGVSIMLPPDAVNDTASTPEDTPVVIDIPNNDTDPNGHLDSTSVAILMPPTGGTVVVDTLNGSITYIPDPNFDGPDSLQYVICTDPPAPTPSQCDTAWVYIDVIPENDPPVAVNDTTFTNPGQIVGVPVVNNDYDVDGNIDNSTLMVITDPTAGSYFVDPGSGVIAYTPNGTFTGVDSLQYVVCDDGSPLPSACDTAWVYVTVQGSPNIPDVNLPPVAINDTATTNIDTPVTIHLTGNDSDPDGIIVPATISVLQQPSNGSVAVSSSTGEAIYTPAPGFVGTDSLLYQVCDNDGLCDTAWVYVTVEDVPANQPPVAVVNYAATGLNTSVPINVLVNDYDPEGYPLDSTSVTIVDFPNNGSVTVDPNTGWLNYTPDPNFSGWDSIIYQVCDFGIPSPVECDTAYAIVYIYPNIIPIDPPVAVNDTMSTTPGDSVSIVVVNNDSDPNNEVITVIQELTPPSNGSSYWNGNELVYTPDSSFSGTDSLQYVIVNESGGTDTAWVYITVDPSLSAVVDSYCDMDVPYFQWDATLLGLPNTTTSVYIYDAFGVAVDTLQNQPLMGSSLWPGYEALPNGIVNYPAANLRPIQVQFEVNPTSPMYTVAYPSATPACYPDNQPPVAVNDTVSTTDTASVVISILPNDDDPEGYLDSTSVTIVTPPDSGTVVVNPDGTITYTPTACFVGVDSLVYEVCDSWSPTQCAQATVYVNVTELTPPTAVCQDVTLYLNDQGWAYLAPGMIDGGSFDACGPVTTIAQPDSFFCADIGVQQATLTVTDEAGNTAQCMANVTVLDTIAPTLTGSDQFSFDSYTGACAGVANFSMPMVDDNCDAQLVGTPSIMPGDTLSVGVHTVDYTYEDASGNTVSMTVTITVVDVEPPVVSCPANDTIYATNSSGASYTPPGANATDNCGIQSVDLTTAPAPGPLQPGVYTYGYTATDVNGLQDSCTYTVTVIDANPPQLSCPNDMVLPNDPGQCGAVIAMIPMPTFVGGQGSDSLYRADGTGLMDGDLFPVGTTTITWVAEDSFGNTDTCSFDVTVNDLEAPVPNLPADFTVSNDPGQCGATVVYGPVQGIDNCTAAADLIFTLISGPASGDFVGIGTHSVVYEVCDLAGNCVTENFVITVEDNEAPVLTVPSDITVQADSMDCSAIVNFPYPTATDNCPGVTIIQTCGQNSGSTYPVGTTTQCYEAVDASGNVVTGTFDITVESSFTIDLGPDTVGCGFVQLWSPTGNKWNYVWQDGSGLPYYNITQSGWYSVQVTNGQGCVATDSVFVDILQPQDSVDLGQIPSSVCLTDNPAPFPLNPNGTLTITGPGVTNNILDPAAAGLGTHTYYYTFIDAATGCETSGSWRMDVVDCTIGLDEGGFKEVRLYPNPTSDHVTLDWTINGADQVTIRVINALGQLIYEAEAEPFAQDHVIEVGQWSAGNYTVVLEHANAVEQRRLVITR